MHAYIHTYTHTYMYAHIHKYMHSCMLTRLRHRSSAPTTRPASFHRTKEGELQRVLLLASARSQDVSACVCPHSRLPVFAHMNTHTPAGTPCGGGCASRLSCLELAGIFFYRLLGVSICQSAYLSLYRSVYDSIYPTTSLPINLLEPTRPSITNRSEHCPISYTEIPCTHSRARTHAHTHTHT